MPAVHEVREVARRASCQNNLLQLGMGLHSYHHTHNVLPPGCVNSTGPVFDDGTSYNFGWIAQLLPYIDERTAYRKLDFQQSVYSNRNLAVGSVRPNILLCPSSVVSRPMTSYAGCHHGTETPIDVDRNGVLFLNSSVRFRDITDGRRHTIMIGETLSGFPFLPGTRGTLRNASFINGQKDKQAYWSSRFGEPQELEPYIVNGRQLDVKYYVGGFLSFHNWGANFCFADGSVELLSSSIDQRVLHNLGNRMDGNLIENF